MSKRKLDDLIDSLNSLNVSKQSSTALTISRSPPAKRGHFLPISVSKLNLKQTELIKVNQFHKFKNIFGLPAIPEQEFFSKEEVEILIDQRERELYKKYLQIISLENIKENVLVDIQEIV